MKLILLTQGQFAIVDDADYDWLNQWKWCALKRRATFYAGRNIGGRCNQRLVLMHREIMNAQNGQEIDHKEGNGLNNQRKNLRFCTHSQNMMNSRKQKGTSRFKGIYWNKQKQKWRAMITIDHKRIHLGYFVSEKQAAKIYQKAANEYFGEFAYKKVV